MKKTIVTDYCLFQIYKNKNPKTFLIFVNYKILKTWKCFYLAVANILTFKEFYEEAVLFSCNSFSVHLF